VDRARGAVDAGSMSSPTTNSPSPGEAKAPAGGWPEGWREQSSGEVNRAGLCGGHLGLHGRDFAVCLLFEGGQPGTSPLLRIGGGLAFSQPSLIGRQVRVYGPQVSRDPMAVPAAAARYPALSQAGGSRSRPQVTGCRGWFRPGTEPGKGWIWNCSIPATTTSSDS